MPGTVYSLSGRQPAADRPTPGYRHLSGATVADMTRYPLFSQSLDEVEIRPRSELDVPPAREMIPTLGNQPPGLKHVGFTWVSRGAQRTRSHVVSVFTVY